MGYFDYFTILKIRLLVIYSTCFCILITTINVIQTKTNMNIQRILFLGLGPQSEFDDELVWDRPLSFINPKHLILEGDSSPSLPLFISIFTFVTTSFLFTILGRFSNEGEFVAVDPQQGSRTCLATQSSSLLSSAIFSKVELRETRLG